MSYPNTRWWAKQQGDQNKSPHDQAPSGSSTGQAASGGSANLTPSWSPRDQGRDNREEGKRSGFPQRGAEPRTALEPRTASSTTTRVSATPSLTSSSLRHLNCTQPPSQTRSISPSPSPVPSSPSITSMMMNREMQHDGKDPYHFYEDNDSEKSVDYPTTPSYSDSSRNSRRSSSSVCSNPGDRSERGDTPAYDVSGWRLRNFFASQRR